jgi:predicted AlkP superfamily pyrophosphatase or phosphodiesterase
MTVVEEMLMKRAVGIALLSMLSFAALAQHETPAPKLIVAIAVDQLSSDVFNEYRGRVRGGLKRLTTGAVFPRGHQSHAATETCPGHATILTGVHPARAGIPANDWQNPKLPRTGKDGKVSYDIYCAEDESVPGSSSSDYTVSPVHLKVPTLGDRMKSVTPATRVVAIAGKDRSAVMMGGHRADVTLWWNGKAFGTYKNSTAKLQIALAKINANASADIARPAQTRLPKACADRSRAVPLSGGATVGTLLVRKAGDARGWRASPEFDARTTDVAIAALDDMQLGRGAATDVLAIGLSATDYVGHSYGTQGAEMCANIIGLDATLGRLFAALDRTKVRYVVVLTADHGGHDLPERNREDALPMAERVDARLSAKAMGDALAKQFALPETALIGRSTFGDMYLAASVPQAQRQAVLDAAVASYRGHPQVEAVYISAEILAATPTARPVDEWSVLERIVASFDAERSGDFYVVLKPYVTPIPDSSAGYVATHGSVWGYDRRVPMLFWWQGVQGFEQPNAVETVDILPTLASLTGLVVPPAEVDGRYLDLMAGAQSNCR